MKKKACFAFILFIIFCEKVFAAGVERYAIYVGSNYGGRGKRTLLYAGSDAENIRKTMAEIGGIPNASSILLLDPNDNEINQAIEKISKKIESEKSISNRTEFFFYYSGHSDEDALLLGDTKYDYSRLKQRISEIPSDIHVVILDSCYSGNFIRSKGGAKKMPFMMDDSSVVRGHAYLSSSSETEASQESDEIGASYFTNALITGLRGAADTSGDKKVTLNELYSYSFNDTLRKTEETKAGPQHPNYNITLVGSGDLVLSDFSKSDSIISIPKTIKGRLIIRNSQGKLVSEINKSDENPVLLAMAEGEYSLILIEKEDVYGGNVKVQKNQAFVIDEKKLNKVELKENFLRGSSFDENEIDENSEAYKRAAPKLNNLRYDYVLYTSFPFLNFEKVNQHMALRENMENPSVVPFIVKYKTSLFDFTMYDYDIKNKKMYEDYCSFVVGTDINFDMMNFVNRKENDYQLFVSPCIGINIKLSKNEYLPLEGLGLYFYPFSVGYSSYNKPYYEYKMSFGEEFNFSLFPNCILGFEGRFDFYWKNGKVNNQVYCGINLGFYSPSKRNWDLVKDRRIKKRKNGTYAYVPFVIEGD